MSRVAVTGSKGFIGSHLVPSLQNKGFEVVEISRHRGIDISDWTSLVNLPHCDAIIHLAAKTFVPDSFSNPGEFYKVNFGATLNALELARKWGAKMVYMSSYFYGAPKYIPIDELHPLHPHNPYAQTKMLAEQLCEAYYRDFGVPSIALRLFNIYGPGQTGQFLIPEVLEKIKTGKLILKDPRPKRDYMHVFDVVKALCISMEKDFAGFNVFNLATGVSYSVEDVVNMVQKYSANQFDVEFTHEYRKGEVLDTVGKADKIKEYMGLENFMGLEEGMKTLFG